MAEDMASCPPGIEVPFCLCNTSYTSKRSKCAVKVGHATVSGSPLPPPTSWSRRRRASRSSWACCACICHAFQGKGCQSPQCRTIQITKGFLHWTCMELQLGHHAAPLAPLRVHLPARVQAASTSWFWWNGLPLPSVILRSLSIRASFYPT